MRNKQIFLISFIIYLCTISSVRAGEYHLLPEPQKFTPLGSSFVLGRTKLSTPVLRQEWEAFVVDRGGVIDDKARASIEVKLVPSLEEVPLNADEAYRLVVNNGKVTVEAVTEHGVYWAMQTLAQLQDVQKKKATFNGCSIVDWPAFRIRGFMQDVGRTYMSIEELKREIAVLSRFKINVFHWHLTENQSWRLQSKIFPMLNDSVNTTRMPGKYYTLEEAKDLVAFCKAHNILLIPEFDMPGHSEAFVRTFRHDMQSPEGMKILKLLVDEVCETFDVPYLHIGTDEVRFTNPKFVPEMVEYVRAKGKKVISWNPGWHYKPGEIDMTHLWSYRGKAQKGIPAIDSKFHYLNHFDTFGDIIALYNSRIYNGVGLKNGILTIYRLGCVLAVKEIGAEECWLKMRNDEQYLCFFYSLDGMHYKKLNYVINTESQNTHAYNGFLSLRPGLFAAGKNFALFQNFVYRGLK